MAKIPRCLEWLLSYVRILELKNRYKNLRKNRSFNENTLTTDPKKKSTLFRSDRKKVDLTKICPEIIKI